jgi:hypothetical protein
MRTSQYPAPINIVSLVQNAILQHIKEGLCGNPEDLYGNHYVTDEIKDSAKITNAVLVISNGIDGISAFSPVQFAFSDLGLLCIPTALIVTYLLTEIPNQMGKAAATNRPGNRLWSISATVGLIAINSILSMASLIAPELTLNPRGLAEIRARELIAIKDNKIMNLQPDLGAAQLAKSDCNALKLEMQKLLESDIQRNDLYLQAYGKYSDRDRDYAKILKDGGRVPPCFLYEILEKEAQEIPKVAKSEWMIQRAEIYKSATTISGIKKTMPDLYEQNFDDRGHLLSGIEATRIAIESTYGKLLSGNWTNLGFSLFFFAISVITSIVACAMAIAHSSREDVQLSFDSSLSGSLDDLLQGDED